MPMARKNILVLYDPRLHLLDDIERIRGELRAIAPELELSCGTVSPRMELSRPT